MGNSFGSSKKNNNKNFKRNRNTLNKKIDVPSSATGRHSIGLFNKIKPKIENDLDESNHILSMLKNRNSLQESMNRAFRSKYRNSGNENQDTKKFELNSFFNYKIIFSEFFRHKLNLQNESTENSSFDYKENEKQSKNILVNQERINCTKSNLFEEEQISPLKNYNQKNNSDEKYNYKTNIIKSFITAISKENADEFFVKNRKEKIQNEDKDKDQNKPSLTNPKIVSNKSLEKIKSLNDSSMKSNGNGKQKHTCNNKNCKNYGKKLTNSTKYIKRLVNCDEKNALNEKIEILLKEDKKLIKKANYESIEGYNFHEGSKRSENISLDEEKEFISEFANTNKKCLNLGLEGVQSYSSGMRLHLEDGNKINNFEKYMKENDENFNTPKKLNNDTFEEDFKMKSSNFNTLIKFLNKDSYSKTYNNINEENEKTNEYEFKNSEFNIESEHKHENGFDIHIANKQNNSRSSDNMSNEFCEICNEENEFSLNESKYSVETDQKYKLWENKIEEKINNFNKTDLELKYFKNSDNLRKIYYTKLICNNLWLPNYKPKLENSIIIFDWDDTLLCTTFLTPNGIFYDNLKIDKKDLEKITKLEILAYNILNSSIERAETFIVTNAAPGWVEYSAKRFYPKVFQLLKKINIISARGEFEKKLPGDSRQWKILTFLKLLKVIDTSLITNFICLGDSLIEMEAAHIFASKFSKIYIKTVKFRENPTPEELYKQLNLILEQFQTIFSSVKNLTIKVEKKSKTQNKTNYTSFNNLTNYDISHIRNSLPNQTINSSFGKNK